MHPLIGSFAGLRPLVARAGRTTYRVSREHRLIEDCPGFFSLIGGKYTTYRRMAQAAVERASGEHVGNAEIREANPGVEIGRQSLAARS